MRIQQWLACGVAAGALFAPQIVMAQQVSSALRGHITGPDGAPVAGADVSVTDTKTGATQTITTGDTGTFVLSGLPIGGPYTIRVTAAGYPTKTIKSVYLALGSTSNLTVALSELKTEEVVVTAQRQHAAAVAINETSGVASSFTAQEIAETPTVDRDIKDIVQKTPYAYVDPVGGGSNPPVATLNIAGANPRCTNFLVDGLQQKDNFGLNLQGYPTARAPIPLDWAEQIQVAVTPYDVQYNDTCGGVINVVTKSGGNELHGSAYLYYKDDSLNGRDIGNSSPVKPPFVYKNWGATLSGPLIEDRLFFFLGYDEIDNSTAGSSSAVGPAGSNLSKTASTISQAQVDQIRKISQSVYGFDPGSLDEAYPEKNERYIAKLTWQVNDNNRLIATYQHATGGTVSVGGGNTSTSTPYLSLPSDWYKDAENLTAYSLQYFGKLTDRLSVEAAYGHEGVVGNQTALHGLNFPMAYIRTPGGNGVYDVGSSTSDDGYVVIGPDLYRHYNFLTYKNDFAKLIGTYTLGNHTIKAGGEYHRIGIVNAFLPGYQSIVRFDSIADFQNQQIATSKDTRSNVNSNIKNNTVYFANGANGEPSDASADFQFGIASYFIQDTFYPIDHLTIEAGLRYDRYSSGDNATTNPDFVARYGFSNGRSIDGIDALLPRLSFSYDWAPQQDYVPDSVITFRGGVGEYSGGFQTVWISNSFANTGITSLTTAGIPGNGPAGSCTNGTPFGCVPLTMPKDHQSWLDILTNGPLTTATAASTTEVDAILPNFKLPKTLRANLGFDMLFGRGWAGDNWKVTFDYLYLQGFNDPYWTNLRIQHAGTRAPDGRFMYEYKFDAAAGRPDPVTGKTLEGYPADIALGSHDGGESNLFIVSAQNSWKDTGYGDFDVMLGYTHSDVTDVTAATSSTAHSSYAYTARINYNDPEVGTSDYERKHRFTMNATVTERFFGDLRTQINIFGQRMSGQHYSVVYGNNPFGPGNTYNTAGSLVYIPHADPATHMVTAGSDPLVTYAPGFDFATFNRTLGSLGLMQYAGGIAPRNSQSNSWSTLINMSIKQDLPTYFEGHRMTVSMDIFNLGNLINKDWGTYTSPNFYQAYDLVNAAVAGGKYVYSNPQSAASILKNITTQRTASTWQISFGITYDF